MLFLECRNLWSTWRCLFAPSRNSSMRCCGYAWVWSSKWWLQSSPALSTAQVHTDHCHSYNRIDTSLSSILWLLKCIHIISILPCFTCILFFIYGLWPENKVLLLLLVTYYLCYVMLVTMYPQQQTLHISFKLSPVHSFTSSNHCLPRDLFPQLYHARWIYQGSLCSHHISKPSDLPINDLRQRIILPNALCKSSFQLQIGRTQHLQQSYLATVFKCPVFVEGPWFAGIRKYWKTH